MKFIPYDWHYEDDFPPDLDVVAGQERDAFEALKGAIERVRPEYPDPWVNKPERDEELQIGTAVKLLFHLLNVWPDRAAVQPLVDQTRTLAS